MNRWFMRLSRKTRIGLVVLATFFGFAGVGSITAPNQQNAAVKGENTVQKAEANTVDVSEKPKIAVTKTEIETTEEVIPFTTTTTYDGTLAKDTTVVRVEGQNGKKVVKTEVKYKDGVETSRSLISETITVPAVSKVVAIGTKVVDKAKPKTPTPIEACQEIDETDSSLVEACDELEHSDNL
jgi:uncharacterized protein YabE (DUF348 family)